MFIVYHIGYIVEKRELLPWYLHHYANSRKDAHYYPLSLPVYFIDSPYACQ